MNRTIKSWIVALFDCLLPRKKNKAVLVVKDRTYFSGNLRVACDELARAGYQLVIYKDGKCKKEIKEQLVRKGIEVVDGFGWRAIYHIVTAGIFVLSHAPRDAHLTRVCRSRVVINLWHGSVFKNIELLMKDIPKVKAKQIQNNRSIYTALGAASESDKRLMAKAFGVEEARVGVIGLSRYHMLSSGYQVTDDFLRKQEEELKRLKGGGRLVMYAPTFREVGKSAMATLSDAELLRLNEFLRENDVRMAVRLHPYDAEGYAKLDHLDRIFPSGQESFTETNLVLKYADILIVDYSSIWIDFLLLNRPIVGFAKDFDQYNDMERGFAYPFQEVFPSDFVDDVDGLLSRIERALAMDCRVEYSEAKRIFHAYGVDFDFSGAFMDFFHATLDHAGSPDK